MDISRMPNRYLQQRLDSISDWLMQSELYTPVEHETSEKARELIAEADSIRLELMARANQNFSCTAHIFNLSGSTNRWDIQAFSELHQVTTWAGEIRDNANRINANLDELYEHRRQLPDELQMTWREHMRERQVVEFLCFYRGIRFDPFDGSPILR